MKLKQLIRETNFEKMLTEGVFAPQHLPVTRNILNRNFRN